MYTHIQRVWWVNCCHFKLLISQICFMFCLLCSKLKSDKHCLLETQHRDAVQSSKKFWKWHAVLFGIYSKIFNTKISECLGFNLRTVQKTQKDLNEASGHYKTTAVWKPYSDCSDKNLLVRSWPQLTTIPTSQAGLQPGIWESPSFLSGRYYMKTFTISHIRWERAKFYHRGWRTRWKTALQSFWTNSSILSNQTCLGFSQMKKFLPGSDDELVEQHLACSVITRCTHEKQIPSPHHGIWSGH